MKKLYTLLLFVPLFSAQITIAQNTSPYWSLSGNSTATTSSKLGTTTNIPLRLFTNNSERMHIDGSGKIGIGNASPKGQLTIQSSGNVPAASWISSGVPLFAGFGENTAGNADDILAMASNTASARAVFLGRKSRGTLAAPKVVLANDYLLSVYSSGFDGTTFQSPADIDFIVDGAVSSGHVPTRISLSTGSGFSDRKERLKVGSMGDFNFNDGQVIIQQSTGNVGIGSSSPVGRLDVSTTGSIGVYGSANQFGIFGSSDYIGTYGIGKTYGVYGSGSYGVAGNASSGGTGVYGNGFYGVNGKSTSGYGGVFSSGGQGIDVTTSSTADNIYAGVFHHNVYVYGTVSQTSDRRVKKNITGVKNAMSIVSRLKPTYYEFKHEGEFAKMNLPQGKHYGLIAQDLEEVLPELVSPAPYGDGGDTSARTMTQREATSAFKGGKGINYTELIPILISAMQEQDSIMQAKVTKLEDEVAELKEIIKALGNNRGSETFSNAWIKQNAPNPVNGNTTIQYYIPSTSKNARMEMTDAKGQILQYWNLSNGQGTVVINAGTLASGTYQYSLVLEGKLVATKKIIIAK